MNFIKYCTRWRYRYFWGKLTGVKKHLEDYKFKKYKTQEIREEVRQNYTLQQTRLEVLNGQIKEQKENPTMEKGEIARLDDEKIRMEDDIKKLREQIKALDLEVLGSKPTSEYREGVTGIDQTLDAFRELEKMLKNYLATL